MAKAPKQTVQTQGVDPAVKPYRDYFLNQAFRTATQRPLQQYGVPGSTPNAFAGAGPQVGPSAYPRPTSHAGGPGYGDRARNPGGRDYAGPGGGNLGFGGGPAFPDAHGGAYGGDPNGLYGTQGPYGNSTGEIDPWVAGPSSLTTEAIGMDLPTEAKRFMNPYEQQVVDASRGDFQYQRENAQKQALDIATREKAFGGSRHGILEAKAREGIDRAEGTTLADLRYKGYGDAMGLASGERSFKFGAGDYMRGLGQSGIDAAKARFKERYDYPIQNLGLMQGAFQGLPMGQTQTTQAPGSDFWSQFFGAGAAGAGAYFGAKG